MIQIILMNLKIFGWNQESLQKKILLAPGGLTLFQFQFYLWKVFHESTFWYLCEIDNIKFTWFRRKLFQILGIVFFLAPDTFQSDGYISESRHGFHFIKLVFTWYWKTVTVGILEVIWNRFCSIQFLCFYTSLVFWIQWFKWV